jgi:hypothetical protein
MIFHQLLYWTMVSWEVRTHCFFSLFWLDQGRLLFPVIKILICYLKPVVITFLPQITEICFINRHASSVCFVISSNTLLHVINSQNYSFYNWFLSRKYNGNEKYWTTHVPTQEMYYEKYPTRKEGHLRRYLIYRSDVKLYNLFPLEFTLSTFYQRRPHFHKS